MQKRAMTIQTLSSQNMIKRYAGVLALSDGNLEVHSGEVVGLVGSNGSGKSTLCKIITGVVAPNGGQLLLNDAPVTFNEPYQALHQGIAAVYQELSLVSTLSVDDNIWLYHEPLKSGLVIDRKLSRQKTRELIQLFEGTVKHTLTPDSIIKELTPDERQIVEILKAISHEPDILILDEATSSLDNRQVTRLFDLIAQWKSQGKAIVFISHKLNEVLRIADRVVTFRNGATVGNFPKEELDEKKLVRLIVGEEVLQIEEQISHEPRKEQADRQADIVLGVRNLRSAIIKDISFDLQEGELLGIGGLQGQGQPHVLLSIFGAVPHAGEIQVKQTLRQYKHPSEAMKDGFALIPGDRASEGLLMRTNIFENLELPNWERYGWMLNIPKARRDANATAKSISIKMDSIDMQVSNLSGGNAQKVVIGKWMQRDPFILLLNDPTKGVDVGAKGEFYSLLAELQKKGTSIILYSSDDEELVHLCDRVLVMENGSIRTELKGKTLTQQKLVAASLGIE
jgi:ribose transport system ATP-binding protein